MRRSTQNGNRNWRAGALRKARVRRWHRRLALHTTEREPHAPVELAKRAMLMTPTAGHGPPPWQSQIQVAPVGSAGSGLQEA